MDDRSSTRNSLDTLADLFLTGSDPRDPGPAPDKPAQHPRPDWSPRLTTQSHHDPDPPDAPPAPTVEIVLLGNLPGFGGPWLTQYAHELAQRHRSTTAVVRIDSDQVDLELIAQRSSTPPLNRCQPPTQTDLNGLRNTIQQLSQSPQLDIRHWLIHLPTPITPQTLEIASQIDRWTLLCGADDAAVVAAYRLTKQLIDGSCDRLLQNTPQLAMMVLGSNEPESKLAAQNLQKTTTHFLNLDVEYLGHRKQMQPVSLQRLGSFWEDGRDPWLLIGSFFTQLADPDPLSPQATAPLAPNTPDTPLSQDAPSQSNPAPAADLQPARTTPPSQAPSPSPSPSTSKLDTPTPTPKTRFPRTLLPPGVTLLKARCPRFPRTRLGLDPHGRLHLIRFSVDNTIDPRTTAVTSATPNRTSLESLALELLAVRAWTRDHLKLLQLTPNGNAIDPAAQPALHLYTDRAKQALALAQTLGRYLCLHLLHPTPTNDPAAWSATELS